MKTLIYTFILILVTAPILPLKAQWSVIPGVTSERLFATYTINSQEAVIGGKNGILLKTNDGGDSWTNISPTDEDIADIVFTDANTGFMVAGDLVFKTTNRGNTWNSTATGVGDNLSGICFPDAQTGYACTDGGDIIKTTDGGSTWSTLSTGSGAELTGIDFGTVNNGCAVGGSGTILVTSDGGSTWQNIDPGTAEDLNGICFTNPGTAYLVGNQGLLMQSTDGGATWSNQVSLTTVDLNSIHFYDNDNGYAAGRDGVIVYTNDGGALWNSEPPISTGRLIDIHFSDAGHGYAVGRDGVILRYTLATGIRDVSTDHPKVTIGPNPITDQATIKFEDFDTRPWVMEIFDLSGAKVMQLEGFATDQCQFSRGNLKSGMYFYTVRIGNQTVTTGKFTAR